MQRQQRPVGERLHVADARKSVAQQLNVGVLAGSVNDQHQMLAEIRHHQVIENAALGIGELGITLAPGRNTDDVLRHQPFQRGCGVGDCAGFRHHSDLAHMGHVE